MNSTRLGLFIAILILSATCLSADPPAPDPDKLQAFNTVYTEYKRLLQEKQLEEALQKGQKAFELGKEIFGDTHTNTAALAFNFGNLLSQVGAYAKASTVLTEAISLYERVYGTDAQELILVLEAYGKNISLKGSSNPEDQQAQYNCLHRALDIQKQHKPEDQVAYAELAVRIAPHLYRIQPDKTDAVELLRESLSTQEAAYGKDALELVPVLMALGNVSGKYMHSNVQKRYYDRALKIVKNQLPEDKIKYADLSLDAGRKLLQLSQSRESRLYLDRAYHIYMEKLGADHQTTAIAGLSLGEYYYATKDYKKATEYLLPTVNTFAGESNYRNYELRAHGMLAVSYEHLNKSELVTEHLLAIGRIAPWTPDQDIKPVVRANPEYPLEALVSRSEGWVVVDFTVDEIGRVQEPVVEDFDGHPSLKDAAINAVKKWRYAPRFVDGVAIARPHIKTLLKFQME